MEDDTVVMERILEPTAHLAGEALDLLAELWPKPSFSTVTLETHQWIRLRRLLIAVPEALLHA
jgi:hypothetical protein